MRKINTIITVMIMVLLVDHIIFGGLHLMGANVNVMKPLALSMLALVFIHVIISVIVTIKAEKVGFKTNVRYNKENRDFWMRRASGCLILVAVIMHVVSIIGLKNNPQNAFLKPIRSYATPLLATSVAWHLFSNVRPLLISLGVKKIDTKEKIIKVIIVVLTLFVLAAIIRRTMMH